MDIQSEKIELARRLLDTESESVINAVKSLLDALENTSEWADLPDKVVDDIQESIRQIEAGQGIPHSEARESYKKWL